MMYEHFFNLTVRPFDITPNPKFLYLSSKHALALTLLEYSIVSQATIAVVTGEVGAGKTTLLRHVLAKAPESASVCLIDQTPSSVADLIDWVIGDLDLPFAADAPSDRYRHFLRHIKALGDAGGRLILMIDEAQNLDFAALEGLRLLTNTNCDGRVALQIVLVGQPELLETLRHPNLRQLAQRVSVDFHLEGLGPEETVAYIGHRLAVANGDDSIIPLETRRTVHVATGGIPRLINTLCDIGMVYAFADGKHDVSDALMQSVVKDRLAGGIMPLKGRLNGVKSSKSKLIEQ